MDLSSKPLQNPAVPSRKILDGEMVLVNGDSAASLALTNQTAVKVWEMADGSNTIQDIVNNITREFQNVPDTVTTDVHDLLELLARDGFIGFEWQDRK